MIIIESGSFLNKFGPSPRRDGSSLVKNQNHPKAGKSCDPGGFQMKEELPYNIYRKTDSTGTSTVMTLFRYVQATVLNND